jgi:hypothetical protein
METDKDFRKLIELLVAGPLVWLAFAVLGIIILKEKFCSYIKNKQRDGK